VDRPKVKVAERERYQPSIKSVPFDRDAVRAVSHSRIPREIVFIA